MVVDDSSNTTRSVLAHLPAHPSASMRAGTADFLAVLPSILAPLVTEVLELPPEPDIMRVYVGQGFAAGAGSEPFVRAVWFTPEAADDICGRETGSHTRASSCLREIWRSTTSKPGVVGGGGGVRPSSGVYTELGFGVMPGKARGSIVVGGGRSVLPFGRNPAWSDALEPSLGDFLSDVSAVLHQVVPPATMRAQTSSVYGGNEHVISEVYQFPRLRESVGRLHAHQVVLRCPESTGDKVLDDKHAWMAASDLHVDPWDGGGEFGCCTVHACEDLRESGTRAPVSTRERHLLLHRGIVVFPQADGGRGVHIRSMVPGWRCALVFKTRTCLHGSVMVDESDRDGLSLTHLDLYRVVTYPLSRIERLLGRAGCDPTAWAQVHEGSDEWTRKRISQTLNLPKHASEHASDA